MAREGLPSCLCSFQIKADRHVSCPNGNRKSFGIVDAPQSGVAERCREGLVEEHHAFRVPQHQVTRLDFSGVCVIRRQSSWEVEELLILMQIAHIQAQWEHGLERGCGWVVSERGSEGFSTDPYPYPILLHVLVAFTFIAWSLRLTDTRNVALGGCKNPHDQQRCGQYCECTLFHLENLDFDFQIARLPTGNVR